MILEVSDYQSVRNKELNIICTVLQINYLKLLISLIFCFRAFSTEAISLSKATASLCLPIFFSIWKHKRNHRDVIDLIRTIM